MSCGDAKLRSWEDWLWASKKNARQGRPGMCVGHGLNCTNDPEIGLCADIFKADVHCCRYWSTDVELTRDEAVDRLNVAAHGGEPDVEVLKVANAKREAIQAELQRMWNENQDHVGPERARELMAQVAAIHGSRDQT